MPEQAKGTEQDKQRPMSLMELYAAYGMRVRAAQRINAELRAIEQEIAKREQANADSQRKPAQEIVGDKPEGGSET